MSDAATDIKRAEHSHIWERGESDWYVEPEWCSRRLFDVEEFDGVVWDPACGMGRIPDAARNSGVLSIASDAVDRGYRNLNFVGDFFKHRGIERVNNIVSNPPFNIFRPFAEEALRRTNIKVALLWLVRTLPAARWLQDTPLARIYLLTPRPSMPPGHVISRGEKPGGGKNDFCWLVWEHGYRGVPELAAQGWEWQVSACKARGNAVMKATDILSRAAQLVSGDRDRQHGDKRRNFENIATMWNAFLTIRASPVDPLNVADVGLMMALLKIARTQSGDLNIDDYTDAAGYIGCAGELAAEDDEGKENWRNGAAVNKMKGAA